MPPRRYAESVIGDVREIGAGQRISRRRDRSAFIALLAGTAALTMLLTGCGDRSGFSPSATSDASKAPAVTLLGVIDGDTIETSEGTVRIIGIDSPETGECGYEEASTLIADLVDVGDAVILELSDGQNERDRHDRLLRYVATADGVDLGLAQLEAGNAVARYDSSDGYPHHPNEAAYHAAQIATLEAGGVVLTSACQAAKEAAEQAAAEAEAQAQAQSAPVPLAEAPAEQPWYLQYPSCAALKRTAVGHPTGPFNRDDPAQAEIYNWFEYGTGHHGDGDNDGLACE